MKCWLRIFWPTNMSSITHFWNISPANLNRYSFFWCSCLMLTTICNAFGTNVQEVENVFRKETFDDYSMCIPNFEIHQDKIIRTEESKKLGAKYLNGRDVTSKDECVKFCCKTPNCNVFVLEERVFNQQQGTCYLFECGSPDNFKCKFTRHHNYSSAVLIVSKPQIQLEDEIRYSQHERELTSLRTNGSNTKSENCNGNAKSNTGNFESNLQDDSKESIKTIDESNDSSFKTNGKCSRFQFECRSSGECIAIYNACDGIPQCADHSDEDAELGCPTNVPTLTKNINEVLPIRKQTANENSLDRNLPNNAAEPLKALYKDRGAVESAMQIGPSVDRTAVIRPRLNVPRKSNLWPSRINPQAYKSRAVHNFNHNQNEINGPFKYGEYGSVEFNPLYDDYNIANSRNNLYPVNVNSWQNRMNVPMDLDIKNFDVPRNKPIAEYYYEGSGTPVGNTVESMPVAHVVQPIVVHNTTTKTNKDFSATTEIVDSTVPVMRSSRMEVKQSVPQDSTTYRITNERDDKDGISIAEKLDDKSHSHMKLEKQLSAEVSGVQEHYLDAGVSNTDSSGHSGAFVSISLGLCITFVMIFVVGYRLKVVRRRIRRGGKLPYAHDADFLVNGMYL